MEFLIVTGLSGAGKSQAVHALEDIGFYCVDNLPPQLLALEQIQNTIGIEALPEDLRELAALRLENPDLTLRELGGMLRQPLSRSGVNHRLRRIVELAEQTRSRDSD